MNICEALARARVLLSASGSESPALDAEVLLGQLLGCDRARLYMDFDRLLTGEQEESYRNLISRRSKGEPVAYITGHKEFMGLDFKVSPVVLVPRPETELLVEKALELLNQCASKSPVVVDVGTGSGAIAVSLAKLNNRVALYAVDLSAEALAVARQNAAVHRVADRVHYYRGNLLEPLQALPLKGRVDLITANLPYIPTGELPGLQKTVRLYEPHLALDGGADGLDLYRRLLPPARELLRPGGFLLMEIGPGQGKPLSRALSGWQNFEVLLDYAGRERIAAAKK